MDIIEIIGIIGMALSFLLFFFNNAGKLSQDSLVYDSGIFLSSVFLSFYAFKIGSIPFLILNLAWLFVALRDIIRGIGSLKKKR